MATCQLSNFWAIATVIMSQSLLCFSHQAVSVVACASNYCRPHFKFGIWSKGAQAGHITSRFISITCCNTKVHNELCPDRTLRNPIKCLYRQDSSVDRYIWWDFLINIRIYVRLMIVMNVVMKNFVHILMNIYSEMTEKTDSLISIVQFIWVISKYVF